MTKVFSFFSAVACSECCVAYLTAFSKAIRTLTLRRSVNSEAVICWVSFWNVSFCWMLWCVPFSHSSFSRTQYELLNASRSAECHCTYLTLVRMSFSRAFLSVVMLYAALMNVVITIFWAQWHSAVHIIDTQGQESSNKAMKHHSAPCCSA